MAKLSVEQSNLDYLTGIKNQYGLTSETKALHLVIQQHKVFNESQQVHTKRSFY